VNQKPVADLRNQLPNNKGRSHQQSEGRLFKGIEFGAVAQSFRHCGYCEGVAAEKVREIAIVRESWR
jgi:hypothetical protein